MILFQKHGGDFDDFACTRHYSRCKQLRF